MQEKLNQIDSEEIKTLIDTALGKIKADMVVANADLVNVYTGELLRDQSIATKGDKIAYVGENAEHTIGPDTRVIDAAGKTLIPGLINTHTHLLSYHTVYEFLKYAMKGGTTTIVTETTLISYPMGYLGVKEFLEVISNQPIKIFATTPTMAAPGPAFQGSSLSLESYRKLLKDKRILGVGETYWSHVLQDDERILELFSETLNLGKTIEGHSSGARGNKLVAYIASGISSCHEPINVEEVMERLRLGIHTMIREGDTRRDLEAIAKIKDEKIDFRRLVLVTDGLGPKRLMEYGYMEFVVQKAIDLGFDPIIAIQMATINAAEHFSLDNLIGGIAPGKYADMVLIPDLRTIQAEIVISNGQVITQNGEITIPPRKHAYSKSALRSVHLPKKLKPDDFHIHVEKGDTPVTVRAIHQTTDLVTKEKQITITPKGGLLEADVEGDILKVAFINRTNNPGKMFVGFIKGLKMRRGAFASSAVWSSSGIIVVGTNDEDIAGAVNRVLALQGGAVVYADGKVLAELPLPIAGISSDLPIETLYQKYMEIQQSMVELGTWLSEAHLTLTALTTGSIPFLRICDAGLIDIKKGKLVDLIA